MKEILIGAEVIAALFKHVPGLVDLVGRWLDGDPGEDNDPVYLEVKMKLDAAMDRLENEIDKLEQLNSDDQ